jgi:hypothetical protein
MRNVVWTKTSSSQLQAVRLARKAIRGALKKLSNGECRVIACPA